MGKGILTNLKYVFTIKINNMLDKLIISALFLSLLGTFGNDYAQHHNCACYTLLPRNTHAFALSHFLLLLRFPLEWLMNAIILKRTVNGRPFQTSLLRENRLPIQQKFFWTERQFFVVWNKLTPVIMTIIKSSQR